MQFTTFTSLLLTAALAAEPNPPQWDENRVRIFSPGDSDCQSRVDEVWHEMGGYCDHGQWSDSRYALMFKPGNHQCNVNVGYYTTVIGLGSLPTDTTLSALYSPDGCNAATANFWRSVDNVQFGFQQSNVPWHVSQAAPMRRANCVTDITLGTGNSSGGFIANSQFGKTLYAGSQQQFFYRNTTMAKFVKGSWNFVFLGCEGAPDTHCGTSNGGIPATTIDETPIIAEKPYITIDSSDRYYLKRPKYKTMTQGTDWDDGADVFDFS